MSGISAIQPLSPGEAWQALLQAAALEAEQAPAAALAGTAAAPEGAEVAPPASVPQARAADAPPAPVQRAEAAAAVLPMTPVLLQPLSLQQGPELRWRVQDGAAWQALFDEAGVDSEAEGEAKDEDKGEDKGQDAESLAAPAMSAEAPPDWAVVLLARLRAASVEPVSAAALRPALQSWRVGLPVLVASPAGLASLQPSRDAGTWSWRRWPARWRSARPAAGERWWAVRLGLGAEGRPRTLRELAGSSAVPAPGQVSCELRLDDAAPGLARWAEVLVQAPGSPSLRALLGTRPSLTWLLCNQSLWPGETA